MYKLIVKTAGGWGGGGADVDFAYLFKILIADSCFDQPARTAVSVIGRGCPKQFAVDARSPLRQWLEFSIYIICALAD